MLRFLVIGMIVFAVAPSAVNAQDVKMKRPLDAKVFGAWSLICPAKGLNKSRCYLSQAVATDPGGKKVVLGISVAYAGNPILPRINFRLSPAAVAEAGVGLKIDNGDEFRLPITKCNNKVCMATGHLDENILTRFTKGTLSQLAYILPGRKQMTLPVSLKGFSEAFSSLTHLVKKEGRSK